MRLRRGDLVRRSGQKILGGVRPLRRPDAGFVRDGRGRSAGGDGGIRTLDRALQPYNGLANRRLQPLGHVSIPSDWVPPTPCRPNRLRPTPAGETGAGSFLGRSSTYARALPGRQGPTAASAQRHDGAPRPCNRRRPKAFHLSERAGRLRLRRGRPGPRTRLRNGCLR